MLNYLFIILCEFKIVLYNLISDYKYQIINIL